MKKKKYNGCSPALEERASVVACGQPSTPPRWSHKRLPRCGLVESSFEANGPVAVALSCGGEFHKLRCVLNYRGEPGVGANKAKGRAAQTGGAEPTASKPDRSCTLGPQIQTSADFGIPR